MITISRRTLGRGVGGSALVPTEAAALLASTAINSSVRAASLPLANAIQFNRGSSTKLSSLIYADVKSLLSGVVIPAFTQRIFVQLSAQLNSFMTATYPGEMTFVSITDALGHPRFTVKLLPPSVMIRGSSGANPSLQVFAASDSALTNFVSYVIPNFLIIDPHNASPKTLNSFPFTIQIAMNVLDTTPPRWMIEAVSLNQGNLSLQANPGYFTNPQGTVPLPGLAGQVPPPVFSVPLLTNPAIKGDDLVLSMGLPITSRVGGYKPLGGADSYYDALDARIAEVVMHLNPASNVDLSKTLPQFLDTKGVVTSNFSVQISQAYLKASTAYEVVQQLYQDINANVAAAASGAISDAVSAMTTALAAAYSAEVKTALGVAAGQAQADIAAAKAQATAAGIYVSTSATAQGILDAQSALVSSITALEFALNASYPPVPNQALTAAPPVGNITVAPGSSSPSIVMNGNASTVTDISTGDQVAASDQSMLNNQVNGETFQSPSNGTPTQAPTGPQVIVESLTIDGQ